MQVEFLVQKDRESSLLEQLLDSFEKKPKNVYLILGDLKETGFKLIEEEFIDTKIKLFVAIGVNKKNTTRIMLENMLDITDKVYYYSNNNIIEFNSNICIFEYSNESYIFVSSGAFSESGITENISLYNKITFDLADKEEKSEYKKTLKKITDNLDEIGFELLNREKVEELVEKKEIFTTRQYTHTNVMSISELLGKEEKSQAQDKNDKISLPQNVEIPKIDLKDIAIDIDDIDISEEVENESKIKGNYDNQDIEVEYEKEDENEANYENINANDSTEEEVVDKENELYDEELENLDFDENETLDINSMLFSKADVKLDVDMKTKAEKEEKVEKLDKDEIVQVKRVNLNNVSNLIFELPSKPQKIMDQSKIKIQNSIQKVIPNFFNLQEKENSIQIDGTWYKQKNVTLELVDVKNSKKYSDRNAKISQKKGQSYLTIESDMIKNIEYGENDIVRIIK